MEKKTEQSKKYSFETFASSVTKATGSTVAFIIAFIMVLIWGAYRALCFIIQKPGKW